jgi:FemAB-related protein (PEP-CTERM system-associated)
VTIIECTERDKSRWNQFVATHAEASFYHRFEWREINETCFGHRSAYLAAVDGEDVLGVFPVVQVRSRLFGNIACSMPFVNYGGPCGRDASVETTLVSAASDVMRRWQSDYLEIRSRKHLPGDLSTSDHKVSMTVELDADADTLWNAFKTGHRTEIRKGYKQGFTVRVGGRDLLDDFYTLMSESWRDLGTPMYSKTYFEAIAAAFDGSVRITMVYAEGEIAAGAFDGLHGDTVEGMWLGTRAKFRDQLVGYVLYWELMKDACERGYKHFHLGRSTSQSGSETFKRKWNADLRQLYWQYVLNGTQSVPELNVSNPKYRLAIETWRRLPLGVTQVLGPFIARCIP